MKLIENKWQYTDGQTITCIPKTIILLITLCTCVAMGQEYKSSMTDPLYGIPFTPLTLEDWDEYVKECYSYADTVVIPVDYYFEEDSCKGWSYTPLKTDYYLIGEINPTKEWQNIGLIYIHTKPTFEGFVEWKRKDKR